VTPEQRNGIHTHKFCEACGRLLNIEESLSYYTVNNEGEEDGKHHRFCKFDGSFKTKAGADNYRAQVVGYAINPEWSEQYRYPWI